MCNAFAVDVQSWLLNKLSAQPINKSVCDDFCLVCFHLLFLLQSHEPTVAYGPFNQNLIKYYDFLLYIYLIRGVLLCPYNVLDQAIKHCNGIWSYLTRLVSFNWLASACLQMPRSTLSFEGKQHSAFHALHVQHHILVLVFKEENGRIFFNAFY